MTRFIIFGFILLVSLVFFVRSARRLIRLLSVGKSDNRLDRIGTRIKNVLVIAFGQKKLLREPLAGMMHFSIFWGFVILLTAILEAIVEGIYPKFTLEILGPIFHPLAFLQEVVGLLVILAVLIGLLRWWIAPPKRYFGPEIGAHVRLDATFILCLILLIMITMFGTNATRMVMAQQITGSRFISVQLASLFSTGAGTNIWFEVFWWIHILCVLAFLNYLPFSKHLHVLTSVPNVFLSSLSARGKLSKLDLEDEEAEKFGSDDIQELTWKQLLDGYTCTDCGRCTSVCPANNTGKVLSPRKIMMNIRARTMEFAPVLVEGSQEQHQEVVERRLLESFVTEDELWACTTCRACMEECPVMIEHVPAIVDMRRFLVLTESQFPSELTTTFKNLETNGSPWAFSQDSRADWAEGLNVSRMADAENPVDILYWVGCAGSFDARYQKVSRAMVKILRSAGVDFAILGTEEKCSGDPARRSGNEYLAQMMMMENVETLGKYKFKRILTSCPHCYNTLKNEYPDFGGNYELVHHSDFINELMQSGKLKIAKSSRQKIAFHDSCYLGRYNNIYEAPRQILSRTGSVALEMERTRDKGFCCGAGGARMFMEETVGKRVNVERTEEAMRTHPDTIATACPFCMTMMTDGAKALDVDEKVRISDVAEVVADLL